MEELENKIEELVKKYPVIDILTALKFTLLKMHQNNKNDIFFLGHNFNSLINKIHAITFNRGR